MKKSISILSKICLGLSLLFMFTLFSCEKALDFSKINREGALSAPNINMALIAEIETLPNYAVKLSYSNLNYEEKVVLWTRHFEKHLNSKKYIKEQVAHINKLFALINVDFFKKAGTPELEAFMKEFEKEWFYKASEQGLFTQKELFFIGTIDGLGVIDTNLDKKPASSGRGEAVEAMCKCYYSISCGLWATCVSVSNCRTGQTKTDCGLAGTSTCTGNCAL